MKVNEFELLYLICVIIWHYLFPFIANGMFTFTYVQPTQLMSYI